MPDDPEPGFPVGDHGQPPGRGPEAKRKDDHMSGFIATIREGNNALIARIAAIAAIGGMLFGYDTGVISGALLYIKRDLGAGTFEQELIVSSLLVGAMLGAALSGWTAKRIGRRWTKVISGSVYVVGSLGSAFAVSVPMLVGFRVLLGLAVGTASFVSPLYISEMAPPRIRGGLTSFNQLAVTLGILAAYLVNYAFSGVAHDWRWMLGLAALPGAALAVGMLTVPSSPRWLVQQGREEQARRVVERLREGDPHADVDTELDDIRTAARDTGRTGIGALRTRKLRPLLLIGLGLALAQQFVGINTVIYYAPTILSATGLSTGGAIGQTVFVGVTNVVFTAIAIVLLDRVGRRGLLLTGTAGIVLGLALLGVFFLVPGLQHRAPWLALAALLLYIASFGIGLGPVFWLMISEIFPLPVRNIAMSACTVGNWAANFVVSLTFLSLVQVITRPGTFFLYTGISLLALLFFWRKIPETKGRSLEQVQQELTG
ncbi:sugar porter family MFS transporter [Amycolatopsis sp. NPDC026612]|uniref:sugar porter family MFS transporter n=1 Tax=Amycolatopsis sp. NPDC026612 TaxID=3155466 RepID=UPI0033D820C8